MVFAYADDFTLLTVSYLIWGSGFAFRSGASEAYLYDALQADAREAEYTDRMGFFWALDLIGATLGGIAGAVLAATVSLQAAVVATAGSYVVALPLLLALQEPPALAATVRRGYLDVLREGLAVVRRDGQLRGMVLLQVILMSGWAGSAVLSQPFMAQHGVPLSMFGVLSASIMLASAGSGFVSGRVVRAIGITRALLVSVIGTAGGLLLLGAVDHVGAFTGFVVTAAALSVVQPAAQAYVSDRTEAGVRATVLSLAPFGQSIALANTAAGVLGDASLRVAFGALGAAIGIAGAVAFLVWRGAEAQLTVGADEVG
jgi:MFS family permease